MGAGLPATESHHGVAAVDRAFAILATLEAATEPLTLAKLARATGFYKSTILRLIGSLEDAGYAMRLRDGCYSLGASAFRLGLAYERQNPLRRHALPILERLVANGTESASLHVVHGAHTRLCLFRVNSRHSTLDRVDAGDVLPLERGAAGRVLLAYSDATAAQHKALRRAGYALSKGERDPNCAGLAAPVFGPTGEIVAALSLSGPGERFTLEAVARMRKFLLKSADQLTQSLGGTAPDKIQQRTVPRLPGAARRAGTGISERGAG
jgi:DNA-binding IclR family transcriptional regulator